MPLRILLLSFFLSIIVSCSAVQTNDNANGDQDIPKVEREFRAAWIATVANINWPSKKDLSTEQQKLEAIKILDQLKSFNFNAVIFQARPQCDALYKSDFEPWSYYLTGTQGKAPDPFYDPLQFWIDEAHKRGMELHVWLNPFRAHHIDGGEVSEFSVVKKHPDWVVKLKSGYWWFDPSKKEAQDHSLKVVMDITQRYDIDGIHFDDYFYPYPSYNNEEDFPDQESWKKYLNQGGALSRSDWRRENINNFIHKIYDGIKQIKPNVKFGLSPFGIWRPHYPESIEGFDQYEKLYADAKYWINKGWVDYWSPQLYWKIGPVQQSFPVLLNWWKEQNIFGKHFWPGINISRENNELNTQEAINQIMITRGMLPNSPGTICWSAGPLFEFKELSSAIVKGPYKKQALVPTTPWFQSKEIETPVVKFKKENEMLNISWNINKKENVFCWVVYFKYGGRWDYKIIEKETTSLLVPVYSEENYVTENDKQIKRQTELTEIAVSAVDRISNESVPRKLIIN